MGIYADDEELDSELEDDDSELLLELSLLLLELDSELELDDSEEELELSELELELSLELELDVGRVANVTKCDCVSTALSYGVIGPPSHG